MVKVQDSADEIINRRHFEKAAKMNISTGRCQVTSRLGICQRAELTKNLTSMQ
jgi:hypothetical protein